jgi:hypothetical protein
MIKKMKNMLSQIINKYGCIFITVFFLLGYNNNVNAQTGTPSQIMANIYKSYDSLNYLSFDVKYTYTSDSVNKEIMHDELEGSYTIAGKKARFNLGDIQFLQNDSFFIAVYNNDKIILVADPKSTNTGSELPIKQTIDSLLIDYQQHYILTTRNEGDTGFLYFQKINGDSLAHFIKFSIGYDTVHNILYSIEYAFEERVEGASQAVIDFVTVAKKLKVNFSNYRFDNFSESLYNENQYIFFEDGVCKPISKYSEYKMFYSRTGLLNNNVIPEQ